MKKSECFNMKRIILFCFLSMFFVIFVSTVEVFAQNEVYLQLRAGGSGRIGVGIEGFAYPDTTTDSGKLMEAVRRTLNSDVEESGLFTVKTLSDSINSSGSDLFGKWKEAGAKFYLTGEPKNNAGSVYVTMIDLKTGTTMLSETYIIFTERPWYTSHVIVDDLIQRITGIRGSMASQIAFINPYKGRSTEIHLIDADGRNRRQLTFSRTLNISPAWSADGKSLAYSSLVNTQWSMLTVNVNTGQTQNITRWGGLNTSPSWSPVDRDMIAFSSSKDGNNEIYTCRNDGKNLKRLTNHNRIDSSPSWSPDGKQMAFISDRTGQPAIYLMNSDGSDIHRLTSNMNAYEDSPCWSPRGDRIAFVMLFDRDFDIATSSPTGEDVMLITSASGSNENPRWSPDGLRIVFSSTRDGGKNLYIMNWDGANLRRLTNDGSCFSPAWAPATLGNDVRISSKR